MKKGLTEIVCILDKSGSMDKLVKDVIGGYNRFIRDQKEIEGEANVTLVLFDDTYKIVYSGKPIQDVPPLTARTYKTEGWTALLDALGRTIDTVGRRLAKTPEAERPEHVIFSVMTDGQENRSKEYTLARVREMVKHQQEVYSWEFIFAGANIDAFEEAGKLAIGVGDTYSYTADSIGTQSAFAEMSLRYAAKRGVK